MNDSRDDGSGVQEISPPHRDRSVLSGHSLAGSASPAPPQARCAPSAAAPVSPSLGGRGEGREGPALEVSNPPVAPPPPTCPKPRPPLASSSPGQAPPPARESHSSCCRPGSPGSKRPAPRSAPRLEGFPPHKHSRSPAGTHRTPFPAPGPGPGTEDHPLPCLQGPKHAGPAQCGGGGRGGARLRVPFCTHRLSSAGPGDQAASLARWRLWRRSSCKCDPGDSGTLPPRPWGAGARLGTHRRGG